jgi:hypothetical protein
MSNLRLFKIAAVCGFIFVSLYSIAQALTYQEIIQGQNGGEVLGASTLALDPSTPVTVKSNAQTLTTASFTPPANSELYVVIGLNSNNDNKLASVTGGGLTYVKVASFGTELGNDTIAYLYTASIATSQVMAVSVVQQSTSSSKYAMLKVLVVTGADTTSPVGAVGGGSGATGTINDAYTSTVSNSWGWLMYADWNQKVVPTAGPSQTVTDSYSVSGEDTYALVEQNGVTPSSDSSVTMSTTAPTTGAQTAHLYFEMLPSGTSPTPTPTPTATPTTTPTPTVIPSPTSTPNPPSTPTPTVTATPTPTPTPTNGKNWYIRKGASGSSNGTDWNNAWNEMSSVNWNSVSCGDTVWIAGGIYATDLSVSKSCTSGAVLNIEKVLSMDSVPTSAAGWNSSYDSQVILPNISVPGPAAYITINGREAIPYYGIQVLIPGTSGDGIDASNNGDSGPAIDHITWTYIEVYGPACVTSGTCTGQGVIGVNVMPYSSTANRTNLLFDHMSVHRTGESFRGCGWGTSTVQYSLIYDTNNDGQQHEDTLYSNPPYVNVTWRYNNIFMSPNDGMFFEYSGSDTNLEIYGNIFYHSGGSLMTFKQESSGRYGPVYIYNNLFENDGKFGDYQPGWLDFTGPMASGSTVANNIFENIGAVSTVPNGDYNAWSTSVGKGDSGTHSFTYNPGTLGASVEFVNESPGNPLAADFHLTATGAAAFANKGEALAAPYNMDMDGNTRGADGSWDVGAYEYSDSGPTPTPTPTLTPAPAISRFSASPSSISYGGFTTLSWSVSGATSLAIDNGIGSVTGTSVSVSPTVSTTYTLTATNPQGFVSAQTTATVNLNPDTTAPNVSIFSPSGGAVMGTITFSANASDPGVTGQVQSGLKLITLSVDGSVFATSSSSSVSKALDTTTLTNASHILTALAVDNAGNLSTVATVTITVNNASAIKYPRLIILTSLEGISTIPSNTSITVTILSLSSGATLAG